jgi:hypothetical protein
MKKILLILLLITASASADTSGTNYTLRSNLKKDLTITGSNPMQGDLNMSGYDIIDVNNLTIAGTLTVDTVDANSVSVSDLTETRVVFAGADGLLADDADVTFITDTLHATNLTSTGTITGGTLTDGTATITGGLGTFGNIIDSGLSINLGVYTDGSKQLTSTPPTSGILGYWSRTGTVITSAIPLDDLTLTGNLTLPTTGTISAGTADFGPDLIILNGTLGEVTVDGILDATNYLIGGNAEFEGFGTSNIRIGDSTTLEDVTASGERNVGIGVNAGNGITSGKRNICLGGFAGFLLGTASDNMLIGEQAGILCTTDANVGIGTNALRDISSGFGGNTGVGWNALRGQGSAIKTAFRNVAIGASTCMAIDAGGKNVVVGAQAALAMTNGNENTFIGYQTGNTLTTGSENILIGHDIDVSGATVSHELNIGSLITGFLPAHASGPWLFANGDFNVTGNVRIGDTTAPTYALEVAGVVKSESGRIKNTSRYTTTQTIPATDDQVYCNGTFTVTLPTGVDGQTFRIINSGTGTITITSAENILGSTVDVILNAGDVIILTFETTDKWW